MEVVGVVVVAVGVGGPAESVFGAGAAAGVQGEEGRPIWPLEKGSGAAADSWSEAWSCPSPGLAASDSLDTATPGPLSDEGWD